MASYPQVDRSISLVSRVSAIRNSQIRSFEASVEKQFADFEVVNRTNDPIPTPQLTWPRVAVQRHCRNRFIKIKVVLYLLVLY
jgi:hypothetical protein